MKIFGAAVGLAGLFLAGSANAGAAGAIYDTITGLTNDGSLKLLVQQNHAPMADAFTAAGTEEITSIQLQLAGMQAGIGTGQQQTDTGAVLVYLVPNSGTLPSTSSGITLSSKVYVGTIADNSLLGGSSINNVFLNPNVTIGAGSWWLVLTSASDAANAHGTVNPVASTAAWYEALATTALALPAFGMPSTNYSAYQNTTAGVGLVDASDGQVFMAQITTPEPASLAVMGVGLAALGLRRRRAKKSAS